MPKPEPNNWLLLIHQIPPKPTSLRVKVWRRLQQIGAVAIKQSVYVLPYSDPSREDLSWTLKEIVDGGGDGSISAVRFLEGMTDEQVITLFQNARKTDYEKIIQEANLLLAEGCFGKTHAQEPWATISTQAVKLQRQFDNIAAIDFFKTPERGTAEILIKDLTARLSGAGSDSDNQTGELGKLKGKVWVTRKNLFVDRLACGWLIRRFVEQTAVFKFIDADTYTPNPGEIRFDMFEGEFTHKGDQCTFEVMVHALGLEERGHVALCQVVHDIDLKDGKYQRAETAGINALLAGLAASHPDDNARMAEGLHLFDHLYAYYQRQRKE